MSYFQDLFADIKNRLNDWLNVEGGDVSNLALDLLNRSQNRLWDYRAWNYLIKEQDLTLDSDNSVQLPSDFGKVLNVYHTADTYPKPDFYYYRDAEVDNGYYIRDVFDKATGHTFSMTFYQAPTLTPKLVYQKVLENFVDSGDEYSYFPADLLLLEAQKIHIVESGLVGKEYEAIYSRHAEVLRDYQDAHQNVNNDMRVVINDVYGHPIENDPYSLDGERDNLIDDSFSNSYDRG